MNRPILYREDFDMYTIFLANVMKRISNHVRKQDLDTLCKETKLYMKDFPESYIKQITDYEKHHRKTTLYKEGYPVIEDRPQTQEDILDYWSIEYLEVAKMHWNKEIPIID